MRYFLPGFVFAVFLSLTACASTPPPGASGSDPPATNPTAPTTATQAATTAPTAAADPAAEQKTFRGKLKYIKVDSTRKSVEAYQGDQLHLVLDNGEKVDLRPSDEYGWDKLSPLHGKKVEVQTVWFEGTLPDPRESYPTNPDGSPMRRGAGHKIVKLKTLD